MTAPLPLWTPPPAPDVDDWTGRHQRGIVRLPYATDVPAGTPFPAWVCCDPACGGVEGGESTLQLNHACCGPAMYRGDPTVEGALPERRGFHRVGLGTVRFEGFYRGPFTPWWEPGGAA